MRSGDLRPHVIALSLISICTLNACATMTGTSVIDSSATPGDVAALACAGFRPIAWSSHDTDATIRQIRSHNASYKALCPNEFGTHGADARQN